MFNLYIDGVVREVNARVHGRGLKLVDGNDNGWELNQLLFADDTVVVADSEEKLCQLVSEFGRVCDRRKLRVNVGKSKVMRCTRNEDGFRLNVVLNGEALEDQFKYLGSVIARNGGVEADVCHRVNDGCKVLGAFKGSYSRVRFENFKIEIITFLHCWMTILYVPSSYCYKIKFFYG